MINRLMIGLFLVSAVVGLEAFAADAGRGGDAHPTIRTPNLDRMAREGQKWTNFYVAACVCTPSRAALMTGRLPIRTGMCSDRRRVLFPDSAGGLQPDEITIAEVLKGQGYATACVGKWHLGHLPQYLPTAQGFDSYLGIPYSNDMDRVAESPKGRAAFLEPRIEYWNVPLMRNEKIVERPTDQNTITRRYTEEAVRFIRANKDQPFFVYLAHSMPHVPLFASSGFKGRSLRGLFGDVIEEIDWSVGQVLDTLRELGLDNNTLVAFTSDNGPWLIFDEHGGSAGCLPARAARGKAACESRPCSGGPARSRPAWSPTSAPRSTCSPPAQSCPGRSCPAISSWTGWTSRRPCWARAPARATRCSSTVARSSTRSARGRSRPTS